MPRRRRIPHFETTYLNSLGDGPGEFFRLSAAGVAALTDLAQMLLWETRWYDDQAQLAELPDLAYQLHGEMTVPLHFDDLIPYLDEIEPLLRSLALNSCCGFSSPLPPALDPNHNTTLDDAATVDYGSVTYTTVADRLEYKCEACYAMIEAAATTLDNLASYEGWDAPLSPEALGRILGYIPLVGDFVQPLWNIVYPVLGLLWEEATGLDDAATAIRGAADAIACAMFQADGAQAVADAMETEVKAALSGYTFATLVADGLPYLTYANLVYKGEFVDEEGNTVDLAASLTPGTNDCCPGAYWWEDQQATFVSGHLDNPIIVDANLDGGIYKMYTHAWEDATLTVRKEATIDSISVAGTLNLVRLQDDTGANIYESGGALPTFPVAGVWRIALQGPSAFSVTIGYTP